MNDKSLVIGALALIVAVGAILYVASGSPSTPTINGNPTTSVSETASGPNLALAQCLKDSGVVFYGAFWCPHCKAQKADFGDAVAALPYVECSTPDGKDQTPICKAKGINEYPTWAFPDGTKLTGEQSLKTLAEKSSCTQALPGGVPAAPQQGSSSPVAPAAR